MLPTVFCAAVKSCILAKLAENLALGSLNILENGGWIKEPLLNISLLFILLASIQLPFWPQLNPWNIENWKELSLFVKLAPMPFKIWTLGNVLQSTIAVVEIWTLCGIKLWCSSHHCPNLPLWNLSQKMKMRTEQSVQISIHLSPNCFFLGKMASVLQFFSWFLPIPVVPYCHC